MAKPPLTRETAKVGQTFTPASGIEMRKIQSPYSPGETMSVAAQPDTAGAPRDLAPSPKAPKPKAAIHAPAGAAMATGVATAAANVASAALGAVGDLEAAHKAD